MTTDSLKSDVTTDSLKSDSTNSCDWVGTAYVFTGTVKSREGSTDDCRSTPTDLWNGLLPFHKPGVLMLTRDSTAVTDTDDVYRYLYSMS